MKNLHNFIVGICILEEYFDWEEDKKEKLPNAQQDMIVIGCTDKPIDPIDIIKLGKLNFGQSRWNGAKTGVYDFDDYWVYWT